MPLLSTIGAASVFGLRKRAEVATFIAATGGMVTTSGDYKYHTFTSSGTFSVSAAPSSKYVDYLIVAGGGGGSQDEGGGGGGMIIITSGVVSVGSYPIVVGAGGATGVNGSNSTAFGKTTIGGGAGGASGGSSGGYTTGSPLSALQPTSIDGGYGTAGDTDSGIDGGGGGGAGGAGSGTDGGIGRAGTPLSASLFAAGGAGENTNTNGDASANTGDGGGHDYAGGSGIVIVRYQYQ